MRIIICLLFCIKLSAQTKIDYGFADKSIPELSQFEYYCGEWNAEMEMRQEDGTFTKLEAIATIKAKFLDDNKTFQSQFTTTNGFFSTDIRTYNITSKKWEALFLNATAQRWHEFTSSLIDGKMTTIVLGGYSGKEKFDIKTVDTIVSNHNYIRNVYRSMDKMKTWILVYKISVKKVN